MFGFIIIRETTRERFRTYKTKEHKSFSPKWDKINSNVKYFWSVNNWSERSRLFSFKSHQLINWSVLWCEVLIQFTVNNCVGFIRSDQTQSDSVRLSPALNPSDSDQISSSRDVSLVELTETKQCEQNILTRSVSNWRRQNQRHAAL